MKVRKLLAMLLVLSMVLSITLPTAVLAVEGDDAGAAVTQTTESTQPDEGGDTATVPDEGDGAVTVPDEGGDTATVPNEGDGTGTETGDGAGTETGDGTGTETGDGTGTETGDGTGTETGDGAGTETGDGTGTETGDGTGTETGDGTGTETGDGTGTETGDGAGTETGDGTGTETGDGTGTETGDGTGTETGDGTGTETGDGTGTETGDGTGTETGDGTGTETGDGTGTETGDGTGTGTETGDGTGIETGDGTGTETGDGTGTETGDGTGTEIPDGQVPGAAKCEHGNDPATCPVCNPVKCEHGNDPAACPQCNPELYCEHGVFLTEECAQCIAAQQAHEAAMAVAKSVYEKIMDATTLAEYAAAKVVDPMYQSSIDALLAEYVATLTEDQQAAYAAQIEMLEALVPPVLSFETAEEIYSAIMDAETKADYDAILAAISDEQKAELEAYVLTLTEEEQAAYQTHIDAILNAVVSEEIIAIYEALLATETMEEYEAIIQQLTEEEQAELTIYVTGERMELLCAHLVELLDKEHSIPQTVDFTNAGPLMPPVEVEVIRTARAMLMSGPTLMSLPTAAVYGIDAQQEEDALYQNKTVDWNSESGTGTITIETYATGKYTITEDEKSVPADIVLVLDQSGSMAYDFGGNTRQAAMKQAVVSFINSVEGLYSSEADHRIAIVTFSNSAQTRVNWTNVDASGAAGLRSSINSLPTNPSGATDVAAGMEEAESLMGSGYNYSGGNTTRSKVVIVFTDGVPEVTSSLGQGTTFDIDVANDALASALRLKNSGSTIYSIGIFDGADPAQLHGPTEHSLGLFEIKQTPCTGEVGSVWNSSIKSGWLSDLSEQDIPAGNRFLNYLSSDFAQAENIGIERKNDTIFGIGFYGYEITENETPTNKDHYLTASDSARLDEIFQTISEEIGSGSTTVTLNEESIIRDVISDYFVLDTSAGKEVEAYTVPCTGLSGGVYQFAEDQKTDLDSSDVSVSSNSGTIDVSGFDFSSRYVAETGRPAPGQETGDTYHGDKLVIKIRIKTKDGFWGGNGVPTNKDASGIYVDAEHEEPEVAFDIPTADVQIHQPEGTSKTTNIYYGGEAPAAGDVYTPVAGPTEDWQDDYVYVTYSELTPGTISNTQDGTYSVTVTVSPTDNGAFEATKATCRGTVNVYTPVIAFADRYAYVTQAETRYSGNLPQADVTWEHSGTAADAQTEFYNNATEPQLTYTATAMVVTDSANDFHVKVSEVKNGNTVIPTGSYRTTHKSCDLEDDCNFNAGSGDFMVHIFKPTITWKDGKQNYNTELTQGLLESHKVSVVWKHSSGVENTAFVTKGLLPDASTLTLTYGFQTTSGAELVDTHLTAETDVQVTLDINGTPATTYTTFDWSPEGLCDCASGPANAQFRIHLNNFDLVVRKTVNNPYDSQDTFLFTLYQDGNEYATFTLTNGGEATFKNLEAGHSYSVEEDTGWSWRYEPEDVISTKTVDTTSLVNNTATVVFTNIRTNNKWLSQDASAVNDFAPTGGAVTRSVAALPPERAKLPVPDEKGEEAE